MLASFANYESSSDFSLVIFGNFGSPLAPTKMYGVALLASAIAATLENPSPAEVLTAAARAHLFMLTNPVDAVYHGGSP